VAYFYAEKVNQGPKNEKKTKKDCKNLGEKLKS